MVFLRILLFEGGAGAVHRSRPRLRLSLGQNRSGLVRARALAGSECGQKLLDSPSAGTL